MGESKFDIIVDLFRAYAERDKCSILDVRGQMHHDDANWLEYSLAERSPALLEWYFEPWFIP